MKRFSVLISLVGFLFIIYHFNSAPALQHVANGKTYAPVFKKEIGNEFFNRQIKIAAIGDSLTEGYGDTTGTGGYVGVVEESLLESSFVDHVSVENLGIIGLRSEQLLERLKNDSHFKEAITDTDIVFVTIGGNDLVTIVENNFFNLSVALFQNKTQLYGSNLTSILYEVEKLNPNAKVYVIGLFNPFVETLGEVEEIDEIISIWNNEIQRVVNNHALTVYVPIDDLFQTRNMKLLFDDQFHPNAQGHELIGDRLFSHITSSQNKPNMEAQTVNGNVESSR